jgi:protein-disulfide isomerase
MKANKKQTQIIIVSVVALAVIVAGVAIGASLLDRGSGARFDYDSIPQSRTSDGAFVLGDPDAPATMVEFADFMCPACQAYKPTIERFIEEYVMTGQARFEYRMLPTQGSISNFAANLAECAHEQVDSGFWVAHDELFDITSRGTNRDRMGRDLADRMNLNYAQLLECASTAEQISIDQRYASNNGISSTPTIRMRYGEGGGLQLIGNAQSGGVPFGSLQAAVEAAALASQ